MFAHTYVHALEACLLPSVQQSVSNPLRLELQTAEGCLYLGLLKEPSVLHCCGLAEHAFRPGTREAEAQDLLS